MSELTPEQAAQLRTLHAQWTAARAAKDWATADALRSELMARGCMGANLDKWHPVFESVGMRERRLSEV